MSCSEVLRATRSCEPLRSDDELLGRSASHWEATARKACKPLGSDCELLGSDCELLGSAASY